MNGFQIARLPRIIFGVGALQRLCTEILNFGDRVLLITGAKSFHSSPFWAELHHDLHKYSIDWVEAKVTEEPSPALVDGIVNDFKNESIKIVVGIGGGSVLDAAKAVAGLLPSGESVMNFLEGVGDKTFNGVTLPFIAVPTTAGTGSEATKNAVLTLSGHFKKSFRHENLVARVAIVDPDLLQTCHRNLLISNGMDAFTQLLESFVSFNANPMTDALVWSGLQGFQSGFFGALEGDSECRCRLSYAALMSGIGLAQTGLGAVHGLASPIGAFFNVPHGVACGTLVAETIAININALQQRDTLNPVLDKYAAVGQLLAKEEECPLEGLVDILREWTTQLAIPLLSAYHIKHTDLDQLVAHCRGSSMKTNPIFLEDQELKEILQRRL
jgi:alcohol dehydrogenase class IV